MEWFGPVVAFIGLVLLVYGFKKDRRRILFAAGLILLLAGSLSDILQGVADGISPQSPAESAAQVTDPAD